MAAYAYLRKSVVRMDDPKNSAEAQEAAVRAMAARYGDGAGLVILSDWNVSGRLGREKRPGYDGLWQAIESGRVSALYSYSMSRLARSVSELTRLFETCAEKRIPIRLEADVIDTSTASGRMTATILASVAVFEADVAGERMRAAMSAKAARGERIGTRRFYGENPDDDPQAVLAAFREAGSFDGAARLLNARGVKPRESRRGWWATSVAKIVRRIDPDAAPFRPARGYKARGTPFTLARLLRCPICSTLLTGSVSGGHARYACRLGTMRPHPRTSVSERKILPAIIAEAGHLRAPGAVEIEEGDVAKRAQLEGKRRRWVEMYGEGLIDRPERDRRLAAVSDALAKLDARRVVSIVPEIDWTRPPGELNRLLRALFEYIELDPVTFQPIGYVWTVPEWRR